MRRILLAVVLLGLASCTPTPMPDTAYLPPGVFGTNQDVDMTAINTAAWVFADPSVSRVNPIDLARGAAAVDYLAGQGFSNPRWVYVSPLTKDMMLQAREQVRAVLGVAPGAKSQDVTMQLLEAAYWMQQNDRDQVYAALKPNVFPAGPEQTVQKLMSMPYMQLVNVATARFSAQALQVDGRCALPCI